MGFASIGVHRSKQRIVVVSGHKLKVKSVNRTWKGNFIGHYVHIMDEGVLGHKRFHANQLIRADAEEFAIKRYLDSYSE